MSVRSDKSLEDVTRGKFENHEITHGRPLFDSIYEKITKEPVKKDNRIFWYLAASVTLFAFGSVLFLINRKTTETEIAAGKKTEIHVKKDAQPLNQTIEHKIAQNGHAKKKTVAEETIVKPHAETAFLSELRNQRYVLPDSSVVFLEKGASLKFAEGFGKSHRNLSFQGKGFFEVQKNKDIPFIVNTGKSVTQVTGTAFNLVSETGREALYLVEGKVKYSIAGNDAVAMTAGMEAMVTDGKIVSRKSKDQNFLAWKTGKLRFKNTTIRETLVALEDYYNVSIVSENSKLLDCPYDGEFTSKSLEKVMDVFAMTVGGKWDKDGNTIHIKGGNGDCK